ncbi:MAG: asparagine synthase B [Chloroflexi bacterium]|nr:asparagine synthase B [Chloroflexota bacterium]
MCGILGAYGGETQISLQQQLELLAHRGPDHQDALHLNDLVLGHTRLAIVDVENGQQPLQSPEGRYHLITNGEIYNHREIRQHMPDYPFQTNSDSEVIIALYQQYGPRAVERLDGMFAFALYDADTDSIYLARDPLGIKPLYYGWQGDTLYFASEIKSVHHIVDKLHEFPPGHYYHDGEFVQYFDLKGLAEGTADDPIPSLDDIRQNLTRAVRKRLMSDVPLGVYLSGGLDSTIIAAIVAQDIPNVHSFAVGVEGSKDLENARAVAHMLGTQHHEYIYDVDQILAALPKVIYHLESFDPSLVRSAIPNYFLAKMTREYVTVVLTGEGADELYAGYHYLKGFDDEDTLSDELIALTASLHNCNLQRCDRMTMAHSIEARVPFLDVDFVRQSMRVPKSLKIHPDTQTEKWALRQAFSDLVPDSVAWRRKEQFSEGAGSNDLLVAIAETQISDAEFAAESAAIKQQTGIEIESKEMLLYYREFDRRFSDKARALVNLWRGETVHPN